MLAVLTARATARVVTTIPELLLGGVLPTAGGGGKSGGAVCAAAPTGLDTDVNTIIGWAKWSVLSLLAIGFFVSVASLVWGRVSHHPRGARLGFDGLMVCVGGAILYAGGYAILTGITGSC